MAGNDDLHPILSKIHETLGDILKSTQRLKGEVEKVHTAVTEAAESIRDAIHENIQAQAELKMMERVVEVRSILPQIEAENERIGIEQEELDTQLDRIADRYEEKHEELDEKAARRVRDLGSHIFAIDEQEFEKGIQEPFAEHVTTAWMSLQAHNDVVGRDRQERVESRTGDVVTDVHEFVDQQHELVERIESVRADLGESVSEPRRLQVPYYTVTVEADGKTRQHVVAPSMVSEADDDGAATAELRPLPGMEELVSRTDLNRTRAETLDGAAVRDALEPRIDDGRPLVSYGDAVEGTMPDRVDVEIEGGE
jgi:regulator of replication initiation timing